MAPLDIMTSLPVYIGKALFGVSLIFWPGWRQREASALAKTQQTVHLGHLDVSPANRAIAKYHWGNKQLEIGTGAGNGFYWGTNQVDRFGRAQFRF